MLTATGANASDGVDPVAESSVSTEAATADGAPPPPAKDLLHAAKRFYLAEMLDAPALAKAREAIKKLPPEKRLAQTCNIEAIAQIGNAGKKLEPDALVANAFAKPVGTGTTYSVSNGAFRSRKKWYAVAYECTLSKDLGSVESFAFHIGDEVTAAMQARVGG
jgi:hypothetical protein